MENWKAGEHPQDASQNVIDLATAAAARKPHAQPFLTDQERNELREMLAWYRINRPLIEAAKQGCTILRRLTEEGV